MTILIPEENGTIVKARSARKATRAKQAPKGRTNPNVAKLKVARYIHPSNADAQIFRASEIPRSQAAQIQ